MRLGTQIAGGVALMAAVAWAVRAGAHASEQGFVLLLPTGIYIGAGVAVVVATVLLVAGLPARALALIYSPVALWRGPVPTRARRVTSLLSLCLLLLLIWLGMTGPHGPLENLLPLTIWTVFWTALVAVQGIWGGLWRWIEPWGGLLWLVRRVFVLAPLWRLPSGLGRWIALPGLFGFAALLLADPAPSDPERLARFVGAYWLLHLSGALVFGPRWLRRCEGFHVLMAAYRQISPVTTRHGRLCLGLPGWLALRRSAPEMGLALFMVTMLAIGSFDGLNETFWWLGVLGLNPLEFPGRSAIVAPTIAGLAGAVVALSLAYGAAIWAGLALIGRGRAAGLGPAFRAFAPSLLPIALGYHMGHYLPGFLVEVQYVAMALNDPWDVGENYLGLSGHYVTTGFFNTRATVRVIWLSQAGAVVAGHVLAVMLAHAIALRDYGNTRRALLVGLPLSLLMVFYTLFGLWLLASPRGL